MVAILRRHFNTRLATLGLSGFFSSHADAQDVIGNDVIISKALASSSKVALEAGTYFITQPLVIPEGRTLEGVPGKTVLQGARGFNILHPLSNSSVSGVIIDGDFQDDDKTGGSAVVFNKVSGVRMDQVAVQRASFQGFGFLDSHDIVISNSSARDCGHRGINISQGSTGIQVQGFHATGCWRAGVLLGYRSNNNIINDVHIEGVRQSVGGAGLWLSFDCSNNTVTNFAITTQHAGDTTCPSILLGPGCTNNLFTHGKIGQSGTRGIYIWNFNVDHVADLHTFNAAIENNRFQDITIFGRGIPGSYGIGLKSDSARPIGANIYSSVRVSNFENAVRDFTGYICEKQFDSIKFQGNGVKIRHG